MLCIPPLPLPISHRPTLVSYPLPVIQLVEVSQPPTPPPVPASYISSDDDDEDEEDYEEEEEDESEMDIDDDHHRHPQADLQSYCSSDVGRELHSDSYAFQRCFKRILLWRERSSNCAVTPDDAPQFDSSFKSHHQHYTRSSSSSSSSSSSIISSSTSTTTNSIATTRRHSNSSSITSAELEMHSCPACDAFFPTHDSLRAHGLATGNEACCVAVEYAFEK